MARKPIMAGNWKMNLNHVEATGLVQKLAWTLADKEYDGSTVDCVVIPPFTDLRTVQTLIDGDKFPLGLGAQNVSEHDVGAYTGEISAEMLAKLGVSYVVVGHSERREYHGETDALINAKAKKVMAAGMTPIICCGEGLDIRKAGRHVEYALEQVRGCLADLTAEQVASLVIAYEPVWAIGTGEVATPEDAQEVCEAIRKEVAALYDGATAEAIRIQYGGSVKASNVAEIMAQPDVDGALVGGASLKAEEFASIVLFA
ncbi:MAG: triose-phosphate isomerase [Propionibacteriaceae bacterium]|nr:triose-phosphate isomerase [Propionibacteriaceae bacterium]